MELTGSPWIFLSQEKSEHSHLTEIPFRSQERLLQAVALRYAWSTIRHIHNNRCPSPSTFLIAGFQSTFADIKELFPRTPEAAAKLSLL